jgi:hypothetical protein
MCASTTVFKTTGIQPPSQPEGYNISHHGSLLTVATSS